MVSGNPPVALYGAGQRAATEKKIVEAQGHIPVCLIDRDVDKHGSTLLGLPVLSLNEAREAYGELDMHVTTDGTRRYEIFDFLIQQGINKWNILNYEEYEEYNGCPFLETHMLVNEHRMAYCCTHREGRWLGYNIEWEGSIEQSISSWLATRDKYIKAARRGSESICHGCNQVKNYVFPSEKKIRIMSCAFIAPCQLSCLYCVSPNAQRPLSEEVKSVVKSFDWQRFFRYMKENDLIAEDAYLIVAGGEFTICPRKNELLDIIEKYNLQVDTNAIIFDERLAMLTARPGGSLMISVDAGTGETYKRIKGLDAFEKVWNNIQNYIEHDVCVTVKYILLPENSTEPDITGFINEASKARVETIQLSTNNCRTECLSEQQISMAAKIMELAKSRGILATVLPGAFSGEETGMIQKVRRNGW